MLAWTHQNEILNLFDNSKIVPLKTKARVWDPDRRESKSLTNKFKNFFQSAATGNINVIGMFKHLCRRPDVEAVGYVTSNTPLQLNPDRKSVTRVESQSYFKVNLFFVCEHITRHEDTHDLVKLMQSQKFDDRHHQLLRNVLTSSSKRHAKIVVSHHINFRPERYNAELILTNAANESIEIFWQHEDDDTIFLSKGILEPGETWRNMVSVGHTFYIRDTISKDLLDILTVPKSGVNEILYYSDDDEVEDKKTCDDDDDLNHQQQNQ